MIITPTSQTWRAQTVELATWTPKEPVASEVIEAEQTTGAGFPVPSMDHKIGMSKSLIQNGVLYASSGTAHFKTHLVYYTF